MAFPQRLVALTSEHVVCLQGSCLGRLLCALGSCHFGERGYTHMAKHMPDLEKGIDQEGMGTPTRRVPEVAENEEQEHLILKDLRHHQVEKVGIAGKMDPAGQKKWHAYWLLVTAASMIILNNYIHSSPKDQLFPPELAMFIVFLCAICLMLRTMKQMI